MVEFAPSSQCPCDVLVKLTILEVFVADELLAVDCFLVEILHLPSVKFPLAAIRLPASPSRPADFLEKLDMWNVWVSLSRQVPSCSKKGRLPKQQRVRNGK